MGETNDPGPACQEPALSVARRQVNHARAGRPVNAIFTAGAVSRRPDTFSVTGVSALVGFAADLYRNPGPWASRSGRADGVALVRAWCGGFAQIR